MTHDYSFNPGKLGQLLRDLFKENPEKWPTLFNPIMTRYLTHMHKSRVTARQVKSMAKLMGKAFSRVTTTQPP